MNLLKLEKSIAPRGLIGIIFLWQKFRIRQKGPDTGLDP
jgi:hypothetical protein